MIKLSRRDFSRFTLLAAAGAAVPMSAFAFGGPSGPATIYKKQGAIGELKMNPYKIAPLTATPAYTRLLIKRVDGLVIDE